jgi:hypothetical protein
MNVAIYSRGVDLDQQQSLNDLIAELQKHDITIYIYTDLIKKLANIFSIPKIGTKELNQIKTRTFDVDNDEKK